MCTLSPLVIKPPLDLLSHYPHLFHLIQQLRQYYHTNQVTSVELKTVGIALWQALQLNPDLTSRAILIEHSGTLLDDLPWECLYHPKHGFVAKHTNYTLSRQITGTYSACPPQGPLSILLWTAQPEQIRSHQARLDLAREQTAVYTALEPLIAAGQVHFYAPDDGRFTTFVELLRQHPWHVVLFSGHGVLKPTSAYLVFEDEVGAGDYITAHTLAQLFKTSAVQCVVIAACQSAHFLAYQANLVIPILQAGVPHVIGMRERLLDRAGSVFTQTLCLALAQQTRIDVAVQQARRAMTELLAPDEIWRDIHKPNQADPNEGQWCLPILLSHDPSQPLLDWHFDPQPRLPLVIGHAASLPNLFIGRRRELRTLGAALRTGTTRYLLIQGSGGIGKTALVSRLIIPLTQQGYRVLVYQASQTTSFLATLAQALALPEDIGLERLLEPLTSPRWLLWVDNLDLIYNPHHSILTDPTLQTSLDLLHQADVPHLRIILTARQVITTTLPIDNYPLNRPDFKDFSGYLQQLGLHYSFAEQLKIYQVLGGNFQGIQLLHSLPISITNLTTRLAIAHRYLQAYQRNLN